MIESQGIFEVVRDIATAMYEMRSGDIYDIVIYKGGLFDWQIHGRDEPCGPSEASRAMGEAYKSVFDRESFWEDSKEPWKQKVPKALQLSWNSLNQQQKDAIKEMANEKTI